MADDSFRPEILKSQEVMGPGTKPADTLLRGTIDYPRWRVRVEQLLRSKGLLEFIKTDATDDLAKSSPMKRRSKSGDDSTSRLTAEEIDQLSGKAMLIIIDNIHPTNRYIVDGCDGNPFMAWSELRKLFAARSDSVRMALRQQIYDIRFQPSESIKGFLRRIGEAILRLRDFGEPISDEDYIQHLIDKIQRDPGWYEKVSRLSEQHTRSPYTLGAFISEVIIEDERRMEIRSRSRPLKQVLKQPDIPIASERRPTISFAAVARGQRRRSRKNKSSDTLCYNCLKHGHTASDCPDDCRICKINKDKCPVEAHRRDDDDGGDSAYMAQERPFF